MKEGDMWRAWNELNRIIKEYEDIETEKEGEEELEGA